MSRFFFILGFSLALSSPAAIFRCDLALLRQAGELPSGQPFDGDYDLAKTLLEVAELLPEPFSSDLLQTATENLGGIAVTFEGRPNRISRTFRRGYFRRPAVAIHLQDRETALERYFNAIRLVYEVELLNSPALSRPQTLFRNSRQDWTEFLTKASIVLFLQYEVYRSLGLSPGDLGDPIGKLPMAAGFLSRASLWKSGAVNALFSRVYLHRELAEELDRGSMSLLHTEPIIRDVKRQFAFLFSTDFPLQRTKAVVGLALVSLGSALTTEALIATRGPSLTQAQSVIQPAETMDDVDEAKRQLGLMPPAAIQAAREEIDEVLKNRPDLPADERALLETLKAGLAPGGPALP
jgi:hypothetical protein